MQTQKERVLERLQANNKGVTTMDGLRMGIADIRSVVRDIRKEGYPIEFEIVQKKKNGRIVSYRVWRLQK